MKQDNHTYSGTVGFKWEITRDGFLQGWHVDGYAPVRHRRQQGLPAGHRSSIASRRRSMRWSIRPIQQHRLPRGADQSRQVGRLRAAQPVRPGQCLRCGHRLRDALHAGPADHLAAVLPAGRLRAAARRSRFTSGLARSTTRRPSRRWPICPPAARSGRAGPGRSPRPSASAYRKEEIEQIVYDPSNPASDPNIFPAAGTRRCAAFRRIPRRAARWSRTPRWRTCTAATT